MPVQGICHAFQFVQSSKLLVSVKIALFSICQTIAELFRFFGILPRRYSTVKCK